jgi:MFS family permease
MKRIRGELSYPRQFWILFGGMLVSATGGSMVWPFLAIFIRRSLDVPLTTVGLLLSLNSAARLAATFVAGPVADRFGRKGVMLLSLLLNSLIFVAMSQATTLNAWVVLMAASGAFAPLFQVGSDAMVADLIPQDRRPGAYALVRMSNNVGVAIGPAIGGFVAAVSFAWSFYGAAIAHGLFVVLVAGLVRETLPKLTEVPSQPVASRGYGPLLRDRPFLAFWVVSTLVVIPASLMWVLLPVYATEQFGIPTSQYGFVMTTNAGMVVLFQYAVTQVTKRYPPHPMLATGALFYALGVGSVALGQTFGAFLASMVILTVGEMILVPTGTTLAADLSPLDMRGRYMGVYGLTWAVGLGIGPVLGGYLNDLVHPVATWYGGLIVGLAAALGFLLVWRALPAAARGSQQIPPSGLDTGGESC